MGVSYDSDFVCDLAICIRSGHMTLCVSIARHCGIEEGLGLLRGKKEQQVSKVNLLE